VSLSAFNRLSTRFGVDHGTRRRAALANLARHTSHDTVLFASAKTSRYLRGEPAADHLTRKDIDGLSIVIRDLCGGHLDLVLHGSGGGLEAAGELVSLLRGRYDSIRALVPDTALSVMSLIAFVCDSVIMPETALLGVAEDPHDPHIASGEAADWVARNCSRPDLSQRIDLTTTMFNQDEGSRSPITAAHARELGLRINLVGDRSGIGADLDALGRPIDEAFRAQPLIKLIENHRGTFYAVEC
jgi:hypothetical protein